MKKEIVYWCTVRTYIRQIMNGKKRSMSAANCALSSYSILKVNKEMREES